MLRHGGVMYRAGVGWDARTLMDRDIDGMLCTSVTMDKPHPDLGRLSFGASVAASSRCTRAMRPPVTHASRLAADILAAPGVGSKVKNPGGGNRAWCLIFTGALLGRGGHGRRSGSTRRTRPRR